MKSITMKRLIWLVLLGATFCCTGCNSETPGAFINIVGQQLDHRDTTVKKGRGSVAGRLRADSEGKGKVYPKELSSAPAASGSLISGNEVFRKARQSFRGPTQEEYLYCLERLNKVAADIEDALLEERRQKGGAT